MLQLPAHDHLDKLNIPYDKVTFPAATEKGAAQVARVLGYRERQMVKTLIFETDRQEKLLVMIGGDQSIVSANLKKIAGSRNIQLAKPEVVKATTGYEIGSIPPFSWQPEGFRSFVEASLMNEPLLGVGTGVWGNEILITPQNLVKASSAQVVNLVDRDKPVLLAG
jgi:Cys-tRNA(Pro)/Cys-tRNA(Cys) deacylase